VKRFFYLVLVVACATLASELAGVTAPVRKPREEITDRPKHLTNGIGMKFVLLPPGTFMQGSPLTEAARNPDETLHKVTLRKGFYMAVNTVTQGQWQEIMGNNPSQFKGEKDVPVEMVTWNECQEFIKKLREKDNHPYRLPTEAEWEYACRAGTTTAFHFGETLSRDQANCGANRNRPTPGGTFPANAWGLHDMHGNVWQWCQDWSGAYPQTDVVDPQGPETGTNRVVRGGSWADVHSCCRSAFRNSDAPGARFAFFGFRLCFFVD
jgi:formylglycine-generating enzyme required for sulfatase activity